MTTGRINQVTIVRAVKPLPATEVAGEFSLNWHLRGSQRRRPVDAPYGICFPLPNFPEETKAPTAALDALSGTLTPPSGGLAREVHSGPSFAVTSGCC
jgi:hypothetical protein